MTLKNNPTYREKQFLLMKPAAAALTREKSVYHQYYFTFTM